jgi:23S rRNA pseudouridine1911/1915/1917 synthase
VHRLDVGTTGLMVVAKSETAYSRLKRAFKAREVDKVYHASSRAPDPLRGTIDAPIDRHPTQDYKWAVVSGGRESITLYDTLRRSRARACWRSTWRPDGPTRSGCTWRRCVIPAWAT